jgi:hypothetical protein
MTGTCEVNQILIELDFCIRGGSYKVDSTPMSWVQLHHSSGVAKHVLHKTYYQM